MIRKTTDEIRELLEFANLDLKYLENEALNNYLHKLFHSCPFTEKICTGKQCSECAAFRNPL